MKESGFVNVTQRKLTVVGKSAYLMSEIKIPAVFVAALEERPRVKHFFETLNKSSRDVIAYGLTSAKKPETRQRRFEKFLGMLIREEKPT